MSVRYSLAAAPVQSRGTVPSHRPTSYELALTGLRSLTAPTAGYVYFRNSQHVPIAGERIKAEVPAGDTKSEVIHALPVPLKPYARRTSTVLRGLPLLKRTMESARRLGCRA